MEGDGRSNRSRLTARTSLQTTMFDNNVFGNARSTHSDQLRRHALLGVEASGVPFSILQCRPLDPMSFLLTKKQEVITDNSVITVIIESVVLVLGGQQIKEP